MNLSLMSPELWNWFSPVWLVAAGILATWLIAVQSLSRWWIVVAGLAMLVLVYVSPVGVLADGYLFSAHMLQHLVLLLAVPLCLVLSVPPSGTRVAGLMTEDTESARWYPLVGWICGVGVMWFWHTPAFCAASTQSASLAAIRDLTFLAAGLMFWWPLFTPRSSRRLPAPSAIVYLFSACLGCTLLGIYITFTTVSVCPAFANPADRIGIMSMLYQAGLTPAVDQSLGGLLMWVPPCFLYTSVIIGMLCRWYGTGDVPSYATVSPAGASQAVNSPETGRPHSSSRPTVQS